MTMSTIYLPAKWALSRTNSLSELFSRRQTPHNIVFYLQEQYIIFLHNNVARSLHLHKGYYRWPLCELYGPECSCSAVVSHLLTPLPPVPSHCLAACPVDL